MATRTFFARNGTDRLVASTICTHLPFFHEAGFQFRTERRRGFRWVETDEAEQPDDVRCTFNGGIDPRTYGATPLSRAGFFKFSCDVMSIQRHCTWVAVGEPLPPDTDPSELNARAVTQVELRFSYDGQERTLRHRPC